MKKIIALAIVVMLIMSQSGLVFATRNWTSTNEKLVEFKNLVMENLGIIIAFSLVTSILILIIHFIRLANSSNRPRDRRGILKDIIITGICTAALGSVGLIIYVLSSIF